MDISDVIRAAREGQWKPVHVLVGEERFLVERAIELLKKATVGDGPRGFNDDVFHGRGLEAKKVSAAARTLPMMATARYVLVRELEDVAAAELDKLADYLEDPSPSTCVVLTGEKLDGRTRFVKAAKKAGVLTEAKPMKAHEVGRFAVSEARDRGHALAGEAAEALVDAVGTDLSALDDALERLSLFVGGKNPIDFGAVEACVTRIRTDSIWALIDAVSARQTKKALAAAGSLLADREPPLKILALVARQLRMVARMREALEARLAPPEAAKRAGAPPFKARELAEATRRFSMSDLAYAFHVLSQADLALKGAKRPGDIVLEETILALCTPGARPKITIPPLRV